MSGMQGRLYAQVRVCFYWSLDFEIECFITLPLARE